jgi:S-DNA-T family DNA segregation ATPase FtsK/SpoIIIE
MAAKRNRSISSLLKLRQETKHEILGIVCLAIGVFVLLALIFAHKERNLFGPTGNAIASVLTFAFGRYVSFIIPLIVFYWGLNILLRRTVAEILPKVIGLLLLVVSLCALLSLPHSVRQGEEEMGFALGGLVGNFIVTGQGLGITRYLGVAGSILLFSATAVISILLTTNFLFYDFFRRVGETIQEWRERREERARMRAAEEKKVVAERPARSRAKPLPSTILEEVEEPPPKIVQKKPPTIVDATVAPVTKVKPKERPVKILGQAEMALWAAYELPPRSLLDDPPPVDAKVSKEELIALSGLLERTLESYGIEVQVKQVTQGPVVTRFELEPAPGVKISRIVTLENDIAMALRAQQVRILAPIPGKAAVGIEIPNRRVTTVYLKELLGCPEMENHPSPLAFALGRTIAGEPYVCDLTTMPHLLIAGATGSGKSVCLNSVITSILFRQTPEHVKLIMIDPKRVELSVYQDIPHLLAPVVYNAKKVAAVLAWAIEEMEARYEQLVEAGTRNIDGYNDLVIESKKAGESGEKMRAYMPHIVIIIDELADLMLIARKDIEDSVIRLSQLSRAVGIHLVIATQRPSVNVITGIIKANFPSRIAFQVSSKVDSRTILDMNGAEVLLGRGDMLFSPGGAPKPVRIQGTYVSEDEVQRLVTHIKNQVPPQYVRDDFPVTARAEATGETARATPYSRESEDDEEPIDDVLFRRATRLILEHRKASVSLLQRRMKIGFARAGRLMDMMEEAGIVGPFVGSKPREIIVDPVEYLQRLDEEERDGMI